MQTLLFNLLLAICWAGFSGDFTLHTFFLGFIFGYAVLWALKPIFGTTPYFSRFSSTLRFALFFIYELFASSIKVAIDIVTPKMYARPGIIGISLDAKTPLEITLVANFITLTPGTLSLDISSDNKTLYVHAMYLDDIEKTRRAIKTGLEKRLLKVIR